MKQKFGFGIFVLLVATLMFSSAWKEERKPSEFTGIIHGWSEQQKETSTLFTDKVVEGVEGTLVDEHLPDGANWSIPNIIRHWMGVSK